MPRSDGTLMWHEMSQSERREFHSEGAVRERNRARREARAHGGIDESTQTNQGNDEVILIDASGAVLSANTFTLDVVKDDNTAGTATFNGSGVN